ncbi:hypothetical protein MS3_00009607 [Schistosoma haematobium]|uniref:Uncharacterized protein n=1 Tax=Schistosoma haematobium TaxID=6185 RepID=A0A6A5DLG5_SCHHA|nr:hypothetical protein MS3_00009607 [Schistosoma haematobium]KAH9579467.1 hypothetical protein MS3_00009607 [Schistosoma haematobium]
MIKKRKEKKRKTNENDRQKFQNKKKTDFSSTEFWMPLKSIKKESQFMLVLIDQEIDLLTEFNNSNRKQTNKREKHVKNSKPSNKPLNSNQLNLPMFMKIFWIEVILPSSDVQDSKLGNTGSVTQSPVLAATFGLILYDYYFSFYGVMRSGLHVYKPPFKLASFNSRTLMQIGQQIGLAMPLESLNIDDCYLSETRIQDSGEVLKTRSPSVALKNLFYVRFFRDPVTMSFGFVGAGVALSARDETAQIDWIPINSRLCAVRLEGSIKVRSRCEKRSLFVISAYAPTDSNPDAIKGGFYHQLTVLLQKVRSTDIVVLAGDLNAQVGHLGTDESRLGGRWRLVGRRTDNGDCLLGQQVYRHKRIDVSKLVAVPVATKYQTALGFAKHQIYKHCVSSGSLQLIEACQSTQDDQAVWCAADNYYYVFVVHTINMNIFALHDVPNDGDTSYHK